MARALGLISIDTAREVQIEAAPLDTIDAELLALTVPETWLKTGDELLIVTTAAQRDATEQRLRAVARRGRLARWFGEHGHPD